MWHSVSFYSRFRGILVAMVCLCPLFLFVDHFNRFHGQLPTARSFVDNNQPNSRALTDEKRREADYFLEPDVDCSDEDLFLIYVYSAPENHQRRTLVRQTWGNLTHYAGYRQFQFRLFFVLGWRRDDELRNQILLESSVYGDLLVANFIDSYFNLTLKGLSALRWIRSSCPLKNIKYVFKTDDDVFVNLFVILDKVVTTQSQWHFMCYLNKNKPVLRNGKWAVSRDLFRERIYPNYCSGAGYLMSRDGLRLVLDSCFKVALFPNEDVFFTFYCITRVFPGTDIAYIPLAGKQCRLNEDNLRKFLTGRNKTEMAAIILGHPFDTDLWVDVFAEVEHLHKTEQKIMKRSK